MYVASPLVLLQLLELRRRDTGGGRDEQSSGRAAALIERPRGKTPTRLPLNSENATGRGEAVGLKRGGAPATRVSRLPRGAPNERTRRTGGGATLGADAEWRSVLPSGGQPLRVVTWPSLLLVRGTWPLASRYAERCKAFSGLW